MAGNSENLGQVAGIFIGQVAPQNTSLIWWDSTPSQRCHKLYDFSLQQWTILSQKVISIITYNELKNLALSAGLPMGKFYVISDLGNALALSITSTKVQYVNTAGNILVDDLGSNIQYYISSNNLTIDGVVGSFTESNNKLDFTFSSIASSPDVDTYLLAKKYSTSGVASLLKFKISSMISTKVGNNLKWNSGLYVNVKDSILDLVDKVGGVVSFDIYSAEQSVQNQSIENIASNYAALVLQTSKLITNATTDEAILSKKITALKITGVPSDAIAGDSIYTVLSKFQRYINKFKFATGINISTNFSTKEVSGEVNSNDTVESAIAKLVVKISNVRLKLPSDWKPDVLTNKNILPNDTYDVAFSKIEADRRITNSLEIPKFLVNIWLDNGLGKMPAKAYLSVINGMLELDLPEWKQISIEYTRTVVYDFNRLWFIRLDFDMEEKIGKYLKGWDEYSPTADRGVCLQNLRSLFISRVYNTENNQWVAPKKLTEFDVSFGYGNEYSEVLGRNEKRMGILLSPKLYFDPSGAEPMKEINVNTTVQDINQSKSSFYLPPTLVRYKLW